jgi:CRP-like cAMP-binding protein
MAGGDPKVELIESVPMFCRLGRHEREQVAQLLDEVDVPAGKVLMRQGDTGREMFVVVSGRFKVERDGRQISEGGPGSVLGEMSLISEGARTATVTATEPSKLLVAGHREFHALMDDHPALKLQVLEGLAEKVRNLEFDAVH